MNTINYKPEHLHELMAGRLNSGAPENIGYMKEYAEELQHPDWSYSVIHNGHLVLCCGIVPMWAGVGEVWFIASNLIHTHKIPFIRFARQKMMEVVEANSLIRVQGVVKVGWDTALRFSKFMGFETEGIMKKYGPEGADYYRISWIKNDG